MADITRRLGWRHLRGAPTAHIRHHRDGEPDILIVFDAGYASPVRTPRGRDILAACGQLKSASEKLSARERLALRAMAMTDE